MGGRRLDLSYEERIRISNTITDHVVTLSELLKNPSIHLLHVSKLSKLL